MCGGVYKPRGVKANNGSKEGPPQQIWQSAYDEQENGEHRQRNPVPLTDPGMKFVLAEIGDVRQQRIQLVMHRSAGQNPSHVGPKPAIIRRVWIAFFIRILMVHAMRGDPENRSALEGERAASRQEILNPFWRLEAAVREQAMITHPDAETSRNPPKDEGYQERFPTEHEECSDGADVKCDHEGCCSPIYGSRKRLVALKDVCHYRVLVTVRVSH